jgi:esterase/lipase superfamily enzyme
MRLFLMLALVVSQTLMFASSHASAQTSTDLEVLKNRLQGRSADEALVVAEAYLRAAREQFGEDSGEYAAAIEQLARVCYAHECRGIRERLYHQVLSIREKVFGPEHDWVVLSLRELADSYYAEGRRLEADSALLRAIQIRQRSNRAVPVIFGTNRQQLRQTKVAFGSDVSDTLSIGVASILVHAGQKGASDSQLKRQASLDEALRPVRLGTDNIALVAAGELDEAFRKWKDRRVKPPRDLMWPPSNSDDAFVFIHGFNFSFEAAVHRAAEIFYFLGLDHTPIVFSWPSRNSIWSYTDDSQNVHSALPNLEKFLKHIAAASKARRVHLLEHSLGNVLLFRVLGKIVGTDFPLGEVISFAPDVDVDEYRVLASAIRSTEFGATLYASAADKALWYGGERVCRGIVRAGFIKDRPLLLNNIDTIDVTATGTLFDLNHDFYVSNAVVVADVRRILHHKQRPPHLRTNKFELVTTPDGPIIWHHWRVRP